MISLKKYLAVILLFGLLSSQTYAELVFYNNSSFNRSCGNQHYNRYSNLSAPTIDNSILGNYADQFTRSTLILFRQQAVPDNAFSEKIKNQNLIEVQEPDQVKSSRHHCGQYLAVAYDLIAASLDQNAKNKNTKGYIPLDVTAYFLKIEKELYPYPLHIKTARNIINDELTDYPQMRDYLLNELKR